MRGQLLNRIHSCTVPRQILAGGNEVGNAERSLSNPKNRSPSRARHPKLHNKNAEKAPGIQAGKALSASSACTDKRHSLFTSFNLPIAQAAERGIGVVSVIADTAL